MLSFGDLVCAHRAAATLGSAFSPTPLIISVIAGEVILDLTAVCHSMSAPSICAETMAVVSTVFLQRDFNVFALRASPVHIIFHQNNRTVFSMTLHINCPFFFLTGVYCERPYDMCDEQPCLNGGSYRSTVNGSFLCECPNGFTGSRCQISATECIATENPCMGRGVRICICIHTINPLNFSENNFVA